MSEAGKHVENVTRACTVMAGTLAIEQGKEVAAANWEASKNQWVLETGGSAAQLSPPQPSTARAFAVDRVWCAMGSQRGISTNPLLSQLQARPSERRRP